MRCRLSKTGKTYYAKKALRSLNNNKAVFPGKNVRNITIYDIFELAKIL